MPHAAPDPPPATTPPTPRTPPQHRLRSRPEPRHHPARIAAFDGIRALATSAVLCYHADLSWAGGGFFGLDVFFVLSGYLITGLLLTEYLREGRISLRRFYHRRAKRLLPTLFAVLTTVCLYVVVFLPREAANLRGDVTAALLYVTNWWYIARGQSYFGGTGRPSLLLHLWSLAVEEQFYLLWPPLLIVMLRSTVVRRRQNRPDALWPVVGWIAALAAGSALLMARFYSPWTDPSRVYYGTDTRAFELFIGAALAVGAVARRGRARDSDRDRGHGLTQLRGGDPVTPLNRKSAPAKSPLPPWRRTLLNDLAAAAMLLLFGFGVVLVPATTPWVYPLGMLGACFAAAILIRAVEGGGIVARTLSLRPLVWFGERSYAVYLWHWPIFDVTRPGVDVAWPAPAVWAVRFLTPFVLAELTYRYVERPVRAGGIGRLAARCRTAVRERRLVLPLGAATAALALGMGAVGLAGGLSRAATRFPADTQAIAVDDGPALTIGGKGTTAGAAAARARATVAATPAPGAPAVPAVAATVPAGQVLPPIPTAMPAPAAVPPTVAFYGDSQGMTILLNRPANAATYLNLVDGTTEGCGFLGGRITSRSGERRDLGAGCSGSPQTWAARAAQERPDIGVLMIGGWDEFDIQPDSGPTLTFGTPAWDQYYNSRLAYSVGLLQAAGVPRLELALLPCYRPVPEPGSGYWPERGDDWRTRHINTLLTAYVQAHPAGMGLLQPPPGFCTDESLATNRDYRWDGLHYYKPGSLLYLMTAIPQLYAPPVT
ncbi:MAG TPA: acyltransferase family protein [Actinocrinis sp.]|nr:acyltransferase family protein [Actinocrinis sp.]